MSALLPSGLQRIGPLAQLIDVLAAHGVPLAQVIDGLGITAEQFRPDTQLPIPVISTVLDRASALLDEAPVGLLIGARHNHMDLGPAGKLMSYCETLGSALGTFVSFQMDNSTAAAAYLHPVGEDYAFGFGVYAAELASSHIYDTSVAIGLNMVRDLTGGAVKPLEVLLSRAAPADPAVYRRFFGCPVRFNEGQTCVILPGRGMAHPLASADRLEREQMLKVIQHRLAHQQPGFAGRVRHALRPLLLAGAASHKQAAAHLGIHPRTLGRRLDAEGVTFETLKDEVRMAVARELLARTGLAVSDIAAALGYATPSAFVRAFRRWTAQSPSLWRRAQLESAAAAASAANVFTRQTAHEKLG